MANVMIHGPKVRQLREDSGHSQKGGAKFMGIDRKTLWRIESSEGPIRVIEAVARGIAAALAVDVSDLAAGESPPGADSPAREDKLPAPAAE